MALQLEDLGIYIFLVHTVWTLGQELSMSPLPLCTPVKEDEMLHVCLINACINHC